MANSFHSKGVPLYQSRFIAKWLRRDAPHPESFDCGVRIVSGSVDGESKRWKYRWSAIDPLVLDGVLTLNRGPHALALVTDRSQVPVPDKQRGRLGFVTFMAKETTSEADLEICVLEYELSRFGL